MLRTSELEDFTVLVAETQQRGRGQAGSQWVSESGKNLTFSVLKKFKKLHVKDQFLVSMAVSISIYESFYALKLPDLSIKWPNDILSGSKKLCGILIENSLKGNQLRYSVIGIGINVNQHRFNSLPHASSIAKIGGKEHDLQHLLLQVLVNLENKLAATEKETFVALQKNYQQLLYKLDRPATFKIADQRAEGIIRGVNQEGKLLLEHASQGVVPYGLKEIGYCW